MKRKGNWSNSMMATSGARRGHSFGSWIENHSAWEMTNSHSSATEPCLSYRDGDDDANARGAGVSAKVVSALKDRH